MNELNYFEPTHANWFAVMRVIVDGIPAPDQSTIPRRFSYSNNEYSLNGNNTDAAAAKYNANGEDDSQFGKLWWDK